MRPIELKMTAFGPYQGTEIVDFTKLEGRNLFLITGPTGAGKTTIFDAISYALYGETSGSDRPEKSVKCQSAPLDVLCQVSLSFELHGNVYRVLRVPSQEKLKSRGEGTTQHSAEAVLHLPGKIEPETGAKNVTEQIKNIIGLELNQFRQIMMIPQGEFRQLLMAKSDERTDILKQIFKTHLYGHLQEKFKSKRLELEKNMASHLLKKEALCHQIEVIGEDENSLQLKEALQQELLNISIITEYLIKQIHGQKETVNQGKDVSLNLKKMLEEEIIRKEQALRNNENLNHLKLLEEKIKDLEKNGAAIKKDRLLLKSLEEVLEVLPFEKNYLQRREEIEIKAKQEKELFLEKEKLVKDLEHLKKEKEIVTAEEYIKGLENLRDNIKQYSGFEEGLLASKKIDEKIFLTSENLRKEEENLENLTGHVEKNIEAIEKLEKKIQGMGDLKDGIHSLEKKRDQKLQLREKLKEIIDKIKDLMDKKLNVDELLISLKTKEALMTDSERTYKTHKKQYFLNQAALLASDLESDMPCPVCGSKDHVALAEFKGEPVSEDKLKAFEGSYNQAVLDFRAVENHYNIACTKFNQGHEGLLSDFNKLLKEGQIKEIPDLLETMEVLISSKMEVVEQALCVLKNDLETCHKNFKALEESIGLKDKLETDHKSLLEKVGMLKDSLHIIKLEQGKLTVQKEALMEKIPENLQNLSYLIEEKKKAQNKLTNDLSYQEKVIKNFESMNNQWIQINSKLESLRDLLIELKEKLKEEEEAFKNKLEAVALDLEKYEALKLRLSSKDGLEKHIYDYDQSLHSSKETYNHLKATLKHDEIQPLEPLEEKIETLKIKEKIHEDKMSLLNQTIKHNGHLLDQIKDLDKILKKYEAEYYTVGKISKVINGKNNKNMTFEGYILAIYLKDILNVANHRLLDMTYNRFQLKVSDTLMDKRGAGGLDLEVYDSYTGLERSVKTLSGGESFKASLAMALGLAEVVQSYAGGIALDTVFIDEGFGTLDQNSLDSAINCLVDLQDSGRLVGIISHVQELKERIKTQLVITSEEGSSTTSFIVE